MYQKRNFGFTLVELMISLSIAVILLGLAAPSFSDLIKDSRLTTQINHLSASLNLGRSEAIKRSVTVTICKSVDGASCGGNWHDGWIVFEDLDGFGDFDSGDDTIIRVSSALGSGALLSSAGNAITHISYNPAGFAIGSKSTFTLCKDDDSSAKGLVISNNGRIRTAKPVDLASCSS